MTMVRLSQIKQCAGGQGGHRCNRLLTGSASLLLGLHRVVVHEGRLNEHQGRGQCYHWRWTSFHVTALFSLLPFVTLHVCSITPLATVTTTLTLNITARVEIHLDEVLARAEAPHRWWRIDQLILYQSGHAGGEVGLASTGHTRQALYITSTVQPEEAVGKISGQISCPSFVSVNTKLVLSSF